MTRLVLTALPRQPIVPRIEVTVTCLLYLVASLVTRGDRSVSCRVNKGELRGGLRLNMLILVVLIRFRVSVLVKVVLLIMLF